MVVHGSEELCLWVLSLRSVLLVSKGRGQELEGTNDRQAADGDLPQVAIRGRIAHGNNLLIVHDANITYYPGPNVTLHTGSVRRRDLHKVHSKVLH